MQPQKMPNYAKDFRWPLPGAAAINFIKCRALVQQPYWGPLDAARPFYLVLGVSNIIEYYPMLLNLIKRLALFYILRTHIFTLHIHS